MRISDCNNIFRIIYRINRYIYFSLSLSVLSLIHSNFNFSSRIIHQTRIIIRQES